MNMQVIVQESRTHDGVAGSLLLMRDADKLLGPGATCLVLGVGGDTLLSIASLAERKQTLRPMALDLIWQVPRPPTDPRLPCHLQRGRRSQGEAGFLPKELLMCADARDFALQWLCPLVQGTSFPGL